MTIEMKSRLYPGSGLLLIDFTEDLTEQTLDAIEEAKKEYPWINTSNCTITLVPPKLIIEHD